MGTLLRNAPNAIGKLVSTTTSLPDSVTVSYEYDQNQEGTLENQAEGFKLDVMNWLGY
jgi:hypothetical protein